MKSEIQKSPAEFEKAGRLYYNVTVTVSFFFRLFVFRSAASLEIVVGYIGLPAVSLFLYVTMWVIWNALVAHCPMRHAPCPTGTNRGEDGKISARTTCVRRRLYTRSSTVAVFLCDSQTFKQNSQQTNGERGFQGIYFIVMCLARHEGSPVNTLVSAPAK